ncbi:MAG: DNA recombination protein RmuC [Acidobacteria bacterium]|nr:DNA recombination protein RmuC [Acidobacteriota bacterium]
MNGFGIVFALLTLLLGLVLGGLLMWWLQRRRTLALEAEMDDVGSRLGVATSRLAAADAERTLLAAQNRQLSSQQATDSTVLQALSPVAQKLADVQRQVALLERDRVEQFGQLTAQLKEARVTDAALLDTTRSLASALRSNSARGTWGEVQLRRVVEAAGMLAHVDFSEQVQQVSLDGTHRPDMVVRLPGGKEMVVDSKVPLGAFLQAHENGGAGPAATDNSALLAQHAKALKTHVDALNSKKYWQTAANSPELVICFVPVESILSSALTSDPSLLDYAVARNVVLASPITLLAVLKAVAFSWRQDVLTDSAKELFELSAELYQRLGTLGDNVGKLGSSLKSSVDRYNALVGSLEARVLPTARKLNALDPAKLAAPQPVESAPRSLMAPELTDRHQESVEAFPQGEGIS